MNIQAADRTRPRDIWRDLLPADRAIYGVMPDGTRFMSLPSGERFEPMGKPRIRWHEAGWWICQMSGTTLGRGDTPVAAYCDWCSHL